MEAVERVERYAFFVTGMGSLREMNGRMDGSYAGFGILQRKTSAGYGAYRI